jgi:hypothetical protein
VLSKLNHLFLVAIAFAFIAISYAETMGDIPWD